MPLITPDSVVHLLRGVPLRNDNKNTLHFNSLGEQTAYFMSKIAATMSEATYTRVIGRGYIMYDNLADNIDNFDYLMFNNGSMNSKWYYAFVTKVEYVNTETSKIFFEIDVMQTFMFDYELKECLIKRSHVGKQDTSNLWVAQENIDKGYEYETIASVGYDTITASNSYLLLTSTVDLTKDFGTFENPNLFGAEGTYVDELPSGCDYYVIGGEYGDNIDAVFTALSSFPWISKGVIGLTVLPKQFLNHENIATVVMGDGSTIIGKMNGNYPNSRQVASFGVFEPFAQREPDYVKFYGFPYSFIELTAFNGTTLQVFPQYVNGNSVTIRCDTVISSSPEMKYYFGNYLNDGYDRSITLADFPEMPVQDSSYMLVRRRREAWGESIANFLDNSWMNISSGWQSLMEQYNPWYEANENQTQYFGSMLNDFLQDIYNMRNPQVDAPSLRTQAGGTTFNYAHQKMGITVKWKMIGKAYRDIIKDVWKVFGYAVDRIKTPDITSMSRFNYIETSGCIINGDIDAVYADRIQRIYDNGITFWHDDNIGDYSNNTPLRGAYQ